MQAKDRIIVALDIDGSVSDKKELIEQLSPYVGCFKIGLEVIMSYGVVMPVRFLKNISPAKIFVDSKLNDTPTTIGRSAKIITSSSDVAMFTVHASAGVEGMKAAVKNSGGSLVLAVTVLTSLDDYDSKNIFGVPPDVKVIQFAWAAKEAGADGFICSARDLAFMNNNKGNKQYFSGMLKVTPSIRPTWAGTDDQKRVATPTEAIRAGADYLVIGRPITSPPKEVGSPVDAVKRIIEEIETATA